MSGLDLCVYDSDSEFIDCCKNHYNMATSIFNRIKHEFQSEYSNISPGTCSSYKNNYIFIIKDEAANSKLYFLFQAESDNEGKLDSAFCIKNLNSDLYHKTESELNVKIFSECMEKCSLCIDGWYFYEGIKYKCESDGEIIYDSSRNNNFTPGLPILAEFKVDFLSSSGEKHTVNIQLISRVLSYFYRQNIYNEIESYMVKNNWRFCVNGICSGWQIFFGKSRYISPYTFSTIKMRKVTADNVNSAINKICSWDYYILLFYFSIYSSCKSFLNGSKECQFGLNIFTIDKDEFNKLVDTAQAITVPVSFPYNEKCDNFLKNNVKFTPVKYVQKLLDTDFSYSDIKVGKFRDIVVISKGEYVKNAYDHKPDSVLCDIGHEMLMKKLTSDQSYIFFNLRNTDEHLLTYMPENIPENINYYNLSYVSGILIFGFLQYIEEKINGMRFNVNSKSLKDIHNRILTEINEDRFYILISNIFDYIRNEAEDSDEYNNDFSYSHAELFFQKLTYRDIVEFYESKKFEGLNSYYNKTNDEFRRFMRELVRNVINKPDVNEKAYTDMRSINDIGCRLIQRYENEIQELENEIIAEKWSQRYLNHLLKQFMVCGSSMKTSYFSYFRKQANQKLKQNKSLSNQTRKSTQNLYAMALFFSEYIENEFPDSSDMSRYMLSRLEKIIIDSDKSCKNVSDISFVAGYLCCFLIESYNMSLEQYGYPKETDLIPIFASDGCGRLSYHRLGDYCCKRNEMWIYTGQKNTVFADSFRDYFFAAGYTTDINIKSCINQIFAPKKIICTYGKRYSCEVTVDKKSRYAYKFYKEKVEMYYNDLKASGILPVKA